MNSFLRGLMLAHWLAVGTLGGSGSAHAAESDVAAGRTLPFGGALDVDGRVETGSFDMAFAIHDAAMGGVRLWPPAAPSHSILVDVLEGRFSVDLGGVDMPSLPDAAFSTPVVYVEVFVDGASIGRQRVVSTRHAQWCQQAETAFTADTATRATSAQNADDGVPLGTIIASVIAPGADGYMPGTQQRWVLSAGQSAINGIPTYDLRGSFLRGIDVAINGRSRNNRDPSGQRGRGNYQGDAFDAHSHIQGNYHQGVTPYGTVEVTNAGTLTRGDVAQRNDNTRYRTSTVGGAETRPRNVAVYFYIKVR